MASFMWWTITTAPLVTFTWDYDNEVDEFTGYNIVSGTVINLPDFIRVCIFPGNVLVLVSDGTALIVNVISICISFVMREAEVVMWSGGGGGLTSRSRVGANPIPIPHDHTQLIWRYLCITLYRFNRGAHTIAGGSNRSRGLSLWPYITLTTGWVSLDHWQFRFWFCLGIVGLESAGSS